MKKFILRCSLLGLLFCLVTGVASANSCGLSGDLLDVVMEDGRWNDYTAISNQEGDFAVLGGRYHNVLMRHKDGKLLTYPLTVWQKTDKTHVEKPKLNLRSDGHVLEITYGDQESYSFQLNRQYDTFDSGDALIHAYVNGLNFTRTDYSLLVSDGTRDVIWQRDVRMDDFNIKLFPRTIDEVVHLNRMYALLASADRLGTDLEGRFDPGAGKGSAPVYSAPYGDSAWRAAKGKASVGLAGGYWQLGTYVNESGVPYFKIRYEVSERTQRIGYVWSADLGIKKELGDDQAVQMIHVPVETIHDTWLTDDPVVSQYQQFYVPPGMQLICMGRYGKDYAYVAAKAKNNSFVDGGKIVKNGDQIVWGYVPLRDLGISRADDYRNTTEWDTMAKFAGHWHFAAGGVGITDYLTLYADGTWEGYNDIWIGGTWQLNRYHPEDNLYWSDVPFEITFKRDNGTFTTKGFRPAEDGNSFSMLYWEGSGGYERMAEPFIPPAEGAGNG